MIEQQPVSIDERVRVSIFERIVPFSALALAALAGGSGGAAILWMLDVLRSAETAGRAALAGGLAENTLVPLVLLYASTALGIVAILVTVGRLFIKTSTASPSGISYLVLGILSMLPIGLVWFAGSTVMRVLDVNSTESMVELGPIATNCSTAAIAITAILLFILLAWSLIPFKSRPGRRIGPVISLLIVELALIVVTIVFQLRVLELNRILEST